MENDERFRDSAGKYRFLLEATDTGCVILDDLGRVLDANPVYLRMTGRARLEEILGRPVTDWTAPHDLERNAAAVREALGTGSVRGLVVDYRQPSGASVTVEIDATVLPGPPAARIMSVCRDVTDRRRHEAALAAREATLQQVMDTASVAIFLVDRTGRITLANKRMAEMFGCPMEELVGSEYVAHVHPGERETGRRRMLALLASDVEAVDLERLYTRGDGTEFWGHLVGRRFRDDRGAEVGLIGVISDVTERRKAAEALRESESLTRSIIDSIPVGMHRYRLEPGGRLVFAGANPAADRILGVDNRAFVGKTIEEAFPPLAGTEVPDRYREVVRTGVPWQTESVSYEGDGIAGAFEVHAFRTGPDSMVAAFEDITGRKRAELALQASEERFRDLAESLPLPVFETDLEGRFTYVNRAGLEKFGYLQRDVDAGLVALGMIAPADRERARRVMARRLAGEVEGHAEYRGLRKDGSTFPMTVASSPIVRDGEVAGLRGIISDLSERKQLEEERLRSQKLESIGTLAGGIAHDFNNLLQGVFGYIAVAKEHAAEPARAAAMLAEAEEALHASVRLANQLLTFSKGGMPVKRPLDPRPVVESAVRFALSGSRTTYRIAADADLRPVEADEGQIGQVVQNVVLNAEQAMPGGGTVAVELRNARAPGDGAPDGLAAGDYVRVSVADTGVGIAAEHLDRIFDPYFTTKQRGSGLGLATSYSIVRNHGGAIAVSSAVGRGTTFAVYLPAAATAVETGAGKRPGAPAPLPPGARVLFMDDEEIVRTVAGEMIALLGAEAAFAEHGEEALALYRKAREERRPFDGVVLDLTIRGGMGGLETLAGLREIDPDVKAIVSSGYSDDGAVADHLRHGFRGVLRKPYNLGQLQDALAMLIRPAR